MRSTHRMLERMLAQLRSTAKTPGFAASSMFIESTYIAAAKTLGLKGVGCIERQTFTSTSTSMLWAASRSGSSGPSSRAVRGYMSRRMLTSSAVALQQQAVAAEAPKPPLSLRDRLDNVQTAGRGKEAISMKASLIFDACWNKMEQRLKDSYVCPREIVWLNGAPGSGKGTNMPFIMKSRGLSRAVGMSQLLDSSPDIRTIIDRGELVPDAMVVDALLDAVLNPDFNDGAGLVIDGFPRTATQVDFVKLLHDKLVALHGRAADGPDEWRFPKPSFKVVILYVDEEESVRRQLKRAKLASLHNQRVLDAGTGDVWNVRTTDISEALCRRRYQVFKAHYNTILRLKSYFPFSLIDAMGSLEDCRAQIVRELRYQSSLDLDERTYAAIKHLPLARDLVRMARQRLVFRLDSYCKRHHKLFTDVISLIDSDVLPLLKQCSLAGHAEFRTRHSLLLGNPLAVDMLLDVLTDRGFSAAHAPEERVVPLRVDLRTGEIENVTEEVHAFRITFDKENVRDLTTPVSMTSQQGDDVTIGTTYVPEHLRRGEDSKGHRIHTKLRKNDNRNNHGYEHKQKKEDKTKSGKVNSRYNGSRSSSSSSSGVVDLTGTFEHRRKLGAAGSDSEEVQFLRGWDSMDMELNSAGRERIYGYEMMNDRED